MTLISTLTSTLTSTPLSKQGLNLASRLAAAALLLPTLAGCPNDDDDGDPVPLAEDVYARLGDPIPAATDEQLATFERGLEVASRRFLPSEGLGPKANVSFCGACHEKPVVGGSGPRYRDFYIVGQGLSDGTFIPGATNGVLGSYGFHGEPARPRRDDADNVSAHRNAIPFFGVGLIAELNEDAILANEDPDDADGDGISGRANYDQGFVGRFGRKSQTVSIEGFIRGPLFNHLGITTDPLPEDLKAKLPVPSVSEVREQVSGDGVFRQAAAPAEPLSDDDDIPDPEMSDQELFDLVSFSMLIAAPMPDPEPSEDAQRGALVFEAAGCQDCHVRGLESPRGLIPLYSDLLLHDMGEELADGVEMNLASGSEFRTQPLWGVAATSPYLHDGRADTMEAAIMMHGGEAKASRKAFANLSAQEQREVLAFLESLGGVDQRTPGLLPPGTPIPAAGEPGAPRGLAAGQEDRWLEGRRLFDHDTGLDEGLGPRFNGDSCRACHFDPVIGGAGPIDVNVMRFGTLTDDVFSAEAGGTILHKLTAPGTPRPEHTLAHNVFEPRQTPSALGLGLIEQIPEDDIVAAADPDDLDGDGISGVAHYPADGSQLGRFGWKAQVPSIREFVRDAMSAELGLTVPAESGFSYGALEDDDDVPDPEFSSASIDDMTFFLARLDHAQPKADEAEGRAVFDAVGCDSCHTPSFTSEAGEDIPIYSDLLLHDVSLEGTVGITDFVATMTEFRTPPLWGISDTAPYMHDGAAETVLDAIEAHAGEADAVRDGFEALPTSEQDALIRFLESL